MAIPATVMKKRRRLFNNMLAEMGRTIELIEMFIFDKL
jgi:hypothetical protein